MSTPATVLVVDDNADHCEIVAAILRREGFVVDTCSDSQTAIALADSRSYAAIVLETSPFATIQPFFHHLSTRHVESLPHIVVATTENDDEVLGDFQRRGVFRVLHKPLTKDALTRAVTECCRARVT